MCAVDVSEVDDALAYLACSADVLTLDPMSLEEVLTSVERVGLATDAAARSGAIVTDLRRRLDRVAEAVAAARRPSVLVLEWTDPAFTAGHWVPDMVTAAGGECVLGWPGRDSQGVEWTAIREADADIVVVSPCGYRLEGAAALAADVIERDVLPPTAEVWAIDADAIVVRPGPRVVDGVEVLASISTPASSAALIPSWRAGSGDLTSAAAEKVCVVVAAFRR